MAEIISSQGYGEPLSAQQLLQLQILIHTHDTLITDSEKGVRIEDPNSHASLARKFLSECTDDPLLLEIAQLHDVPFSLYRNFARFGEVNEERFEDLLSRMGDIDRFLLFQLIDNTTVGKLEPPQKEIEVHPVEWSFSELLGREELDLTRDYAGVFRDLANRLTS